MTDATSIAADQETFAASIDAPADRLQYCLDRAVAVYSDGPWAADCNTTYLAGRLLGLSRERAGILLGRAHFKGIDRALAYHIEKPYFPEIKVGALDKRVLGWVYFAKSVNHPHVLKIGFSASVEKRLKEVGRLYGERVELVRCFPGTKMDERQEHGRRWRDQCAHEWFFDPAANFRDIPPFLLPENIPVKIEQRRGHVAVRQGFLRRLHEKTNQSNESRHDQR